VGDQNILVNNTSLAGHVQLGSHTNLAGYTLVSPFCKIGDFVHTSAGSVISKHVPCFLRLSNDPVKALGLNKVGLQRSGLFTQDELNALMKAYRMIYKKGCLLAEVKTQLQMSEDYRLYAVVRQFYQSLSGGDKGIIR
jgi:UDP-N-acetylglucosamine acyltransferase